MEGKADKFNSSIQEHMKEFKLLRNPQCGEQVKR